MIVQWGGVRIGETIESQHEKLRPARTPKAGVTLLGTIRAELIDVPEPYRNSSDPPSTSGPNLCDASPFRGQENMHHRYWK